MGNPIIKPELIEIQKVKKINDALLAGNHSFAFLGELEPVINEEPCSTYREAFKDYTRALYVIYHDFGMNFLMCYCSELHRKNVNLQIIYHVLLVEDCRAAVNHSNDFAGARERAFWEIKNYVFNSNEKVFPFKDWNEFFVKAKEIQWEKVVKKLVKDSNSLYFLLSKIALNDKELKEVAISVKDDFMNGEFNIPYIKKPYNLNKKIKKLYNKSFDGRFFRIIKNKLLNSGRFDNFDKTRVENELNYLINQNNYKDDRTASEKKAGKKTPSEIIEIIINVITEDLQGKYNFNFTTETLYEDILDTVEREIKNQIKAGRIVAGIPV